MFVLTAIGGAGKSALTWKFFDADGVENWEKRRLAGGLWWSFYQPGATFDKFIKCLYSYITGMVKVEVAEQPLPELSRRVLDLLKRHPFLVVLDGAERLLLHYSRTDAAYIDDSVFEEGRAYSEPEFRSEKTKQAHGGRPRRRTFDGDKLRELRERREFTQDGFPAPSRVEKHAVRLGEQRASSDRSEARETRRAPRQESSRDRRGIGECGILTRATRALNNERDLHINLPPPKLPQSSLGESKTGRERRHCTNRTFRRPLVPASRE